MGKLIPYLNFNGQCEEALHFYESSLGGTIEEISRFGEAPEEEQSEAQKNLIMHAHLSFWGGDIYASDVPEGWKPAAASENLQVNLLLSFDDLKAAKATFAKLAEGGKITMPLEKQFWGDIFGMLIDKFGVNWMCDCSEGS